MWNWHKFTTTWWWRFVLNNDGNIWIWTTAPSEKLEVKWWNIKVTRDATYVWSWTQAISHGSPDNYWSYYFVPSLATADFAITDKDRNQRFLVKNNGNVWIWTSSPWDMLEVQNRTNGRDSSISIYKANWSDTDKASIKIGYDAAANLEISRSRANADINYVSNQSWADQIFTTTWAGNFVYTNGNVWIWTTSPTEKLHVNWNINLNWGSVKNHGDIFWGVLSLHTWEFKTSLGSSWTVTIPAEWAISCHTWWDACIKKFTADQWAIEFTVSGIWAGPTDFPWSFACYATSAWDNEVKLSWYLEWWWQWAVSVKTDNNWHCYWSTSGCAVVYVKDDNLSHDSYWVICRKLW